ncbi:hypothetical protein RJ641_027231 [Dillenia turbinata]|uniref:Uncharacterized protein n=1 Tax=Dillenia turbinata TaxID=194707 RepID=A0AAN8W210_9MAGN
MLQLFFAVAFSAVPLTLYVPPIRSLNLFVETLENLLRQTTVYTLRAYPRIRLACSRLLSSVLRVRRCYHDLLGFPNKYFSKPGVKEPFGFVSVFVAVELLSFVVDDSEYKTCCANMPSAGTSLLLNPSRVCRVRVNAENLLRGQIMRLCVDESALDNMDMVEE